MRLDRTNTKGRFGKCLGEVTYSQATTIQLVGLTHATIALMNVPVHGRLTLSVSVNEHPRGAPSIRGLGHRSSYQISVQTFLVCGGKVVVGRDLWGYIAISTGAAQRREMAGAVGLSSVLRRTCRM